MTIQDKIDLIESYLEEPNSNDPRWVETLEYCKVLLTKEKKLVEQNRSKPDQFTQYQARFDQGAFRKR